MLYILTQQFEQFEQFKQFKQLITYAKSFGQLGVPDI